MPLDQISLSTILPFAIFGAVFLVGWWALSTFAGSRGRSTERLDDFINPNTRGGERNDQKQTSVQAMSKMLQRASPTLAAPLQSTNAKEVGQLRSRLNIAGFRGETAPTIYLGLKFTGLMLGLFLGGGGMLLTAGATQKTLFAVVLTAGGMFYLPEIILYFISSSRKEKIFLSMPDALDLLVVCVESGLGLDQAMRKVADEMKEDHKVMAGEFALCNFQLQVGRPRHQVLRELGERNGVDDLRSLAAILIQADKFGSSIAQALRVQSDAMRVRRHQLAEEKAAKTAVKLIFPLVLFIFPGIFVVLVGPAAIIMVNKMLPIMAAS